MKTILISAITAGLFAIGASAHANSFTNGDFASNGGNGQINYNTSATDWYVPGDDGNSYTFIYAAGTADHAGTAGTYGDNQLWGLANGGLDAIPAPPSGAAYFIAQDGDFQISPLNQDITGLHVGKTYTVAFDYGYAQQESFYGDTIQQWSVSLGASPSQYTPALTNPSQGFTGWFHESFNFVANNPAETLSFLAHGNLPVPPFAVLSGVTFTPDTSAVPEPATWTMMILGVGGIGAMARRRRAAGLAAVATAA